MENLMRWHTPDDPAEPEMSSKSSASVSRAEFEAQMSAQRMRNASAVVRAQQKVARNRRKPIRHAK
jgi:hypothetical protein